MDWLLRILADESTRASLGWLGGGLAALAAGIWAVVKFWVERPGARGRGSEARNNGSRPSNVRISASGRSIAAGRDVTIGVKSLHFVVWSLGFVAILLFVASAFGDNAVRSLVDPTEPIPSFTISLTCGDSEKNNGSEFTLSEDERNALVRFAGFIKDHANETVYVSMTIPKECGGCGCPRDVKNEKDFHEKTADNHSAMGSTEASLFIFGDPLQPDQISDHGARVNHAGIKLLAYSPGDWAHANSFHIPRAEQLSDPQYLSGEYGMFVSFSGLFTARYLSRTGGDVLSLDPLSPSDSESKQLRCIRQTGTLTTLQRHYLNCANQ